MSLNKNPRKRFREMLDIQIECSTIHIEMAEV